MESEVEVDAFPTETFKGRVSQVRYAPGRPSRGSLPTQPSSMSRTPM